MPKPVARLTSPAQVVAALPLQLGYVPTESLVVVCCHEPRGRLGLTLRFDLPPVAGEPELVEEVVARVRHEQASRLVVVVWTDEPDGPDRARSGLVRSLRQALPEVVWTEAALVRGGRFWSYLCEVPTCCPPEGRLVDEARQSDAVQLIEAEGVLSGRAVLADRASLARSLAGPVGRAAAAARARCHRAELRLAEQLRRAGLEATAAQALALWESAVRRFADPPAGLDPTEAAVLAVSLCDRWLRDQVAGCPDADVPALLGLLEEVLRRTPAPYDADACALYAWVRYGTGGGTEVTLALERALTSDPAHRLAGLVLDLLLAQVSPAVVRDLARQVHGVPRGGVPLPEVG